MASQFSLLAWRIPWMEEPAGLQSTGSQRVRHDRSMLARTHNSHIAGGTVAEAEAPILCPPDVKSRLTGKDPDAGKD